MKRLLVAVMAVLMLAMPGASGETDIPEDGMFDFSFDDGGYTGSWLRVDDLGLEFCLPDGWQPAEPQAGAA